MRCAVIFLLGVSTALITQEVSAKTLSKEEVEALWDSFLRQETYSPITDPNDKRITASEKREGYLWGFFGLSDGGGWDIEGHLEAEVSIQEGLLQLYSRGSTKWSPGFMVPPIAAIEPRYDHDKYPMWEFCLILRNPIHRQKIQMLKSVPVPTQEVLHQPQFRFKPEDPSCPLGYRCPRGELSYDAKRKAAVIKIVGVLHPFSVEVSLHGD